VDLKNSRKSHFANIFTSGHGKSFVLVFLCLGHDQIMLALVLTYEIQYLMNSASNGQGKGNKGLTAAGF
jgi:hypothetical protein